MTKTIANLILPTATIKAALKQLDDCADKLLIVVDSQQCLLGTFTDGDIRRSLLKGHTLDESIEGLYCKDCFSIHENDFSSQLAATACQDKQYLGLPIVDDANRVTDYYSYYKQSHSTKKVVSKQYSDIPVVIMGGGKGTRMKPISDVFPKPLIPINGKPMIDHVIDYFRRIAVDTFHITLNYKSELMKAYFNSIEKNYSVNFVVEEFFMGTAGSVALLKDDLPDTFIVSNCDCLVNTDFNAVLDQHFEKQSLLTVVCSIQHHQIPYGKINYKEGGELVSIEEKPELSMPINTGVYVVNKKALDFINTESLFHMSHLMEALVKESLPVHCYFVSEKEFVDFGQWKEYQHSADLMR